MGITLGTDTLVDVGATCSSGPATAMRGVPLGMAEGTQVTDAGTEGAVLHSTVLLRSWRSPRLLPQRQILNLVV